MVILICAGMTATRDISVKDVAMDLKMSHMEIQKMHDDASIGTQILVKENECLLY